MKFIQFCCPGCGDGSMIDLSVFKAHTELEEELALARAVVEAARKIKQVYPGGKMLWFSEFDGFEAALADYDKVRGKGELPG